MKYIGMDGHSSTCRFSVFNENGLEIDNVNIVTNGRLLVQYVQSIEGPKKLTFEECELSQWFYEVLKRHVDELVVCNPVDNRQYKRAKTDKLDARSLAQLLRGGFLNAVYHDGSKREQLRSLISGYQDVVEEGVRLKNRYKSLFRKEGNRLTGESIYNDESLLKGFVRADFRFMGEQIFSMLKSMEEARQKYLKEIRKRSKSFKEITLLKTIPGIGELHSARIVSQVIDPKRFPNKHKYFSYCGLVRHQRESGGHDYGSKKIWGNRVLKCVYKMAARSALRTRDNSFFRYYEYLRSKGMSDQNATNAVCRKIAAISLSLWKNNKKYEDKILSGLIKDKLAA